jgi:hypothetical protein
VSSSSPGGTERTRGTSTDTGVGLGESGSSPWRRATTRATFGPSMVSASRSTASSTSSGTMRSGAPCPGSSDGPRSAPGGEVPIGTSLYLAMGTSRAVVRCEVTLPLGRESSSRRVLIPSCPAHSRWSARCLTKRQALAEHCRSSGQSATPTPDYWVRAQGEAGAERYGKLEPWSAMDGQLWPACGPAALDREAPEAGRPAEKLG